MKISSLASRAVIPLLVATTYVSASAQEPRRLAQPDSIPLELATALVAAGGVGGDPQILVGAMPGWMSNKMYVAPNAHVLGSAFIGTTAVAIVSTSDMPDVAMATLKRELSARGWKTPPAQPQYGGGFRPASMNVVGNSDPTRAVLCGADQQMITTTATRRRGVSTDIVMRVATISGYGTCNPRPLPPGFRPPPFPVVYQPQGVLDAGQACNNEDMFGGSGPSAIVRAPMSSESLLDHYAKQLQDSGWASPAAAGSVIGRTWTRTDSTGAPVELTITAVSSLRDPSCRTLNMNLRTLKKP